MSSDIWLFSYKILKFKVSSNINVHGLANRKQFCKFAAIKASAGPFIPSTQAPLQTHDHDANTISVRHENLKPIMRTF